MISSTHNHPLDLHLSPCFRDCPRSASTASFASPPLHSIRSEILGNFSIKLCHAIPSAPSPFATECHDAFFRSFFFLFVWLIPTRFIVVPGRTCQQIQANPRMADIPNVHTVCAHKFVSPQAMANTQKHTHTQSNLKIVVQTSSSMFTRFRMLQSLLYLSVSLSSFSGWDLDQTAVLLCMFRGCVVFQQKNNNKKSNTLAQVFPPFGEIGTSTPPERQEIFYLRVYPFPCKQPLEKLESNSWELAYRNTQSKQSSLHAAHSVPARTHVGWRLLRLHATQIVPASRAIEYWHGKRTYSRDSRNGTWWWYFGVCVSRYSWWVFPRLWIALWLCCTARFSPWRWVA